MALLEQTCVHLYTCYQKHPGQSDEYHHHVHEVYVLQHVQYPMTQQRFDDLTKQTYI